MIGASIVVYKTNPQELVSVCRAALSSVIDVVWVVDNSPSDELHSIVEQWTPRIQYIFGQGNVGYGAGHNMAIFKNIEAGGTYHVILNPDVDFAPDAIIELAQYMDQHENVGLVMPKVLYPSGELQYLCKLLPSPVDLIGRKFIPVKNIVEQRNVRYEMRGSGYNHEMFVPFCSGCFMFCRVDVLKRIHGFDDTFFMYCEDIDLCRRINMAGYKTMYYPDAKVIHIHKKESFKSKAMLKIHIKSAIRYFNKWGWIWDRYRNKLNRIARDQYE